MQCSSCCRAWVTAIFNLLCPWKTSWAANFSCLFMSTFTAYICNSVVVLAREELAVISRRKIFKGEWQRFHNKPREMVESSLNRLNWDLEIWVPFLALTYDFLLSVCTSGTEPRSWLWLQETTAIQKIKWSGPVWIVCYPGEFLERSWSCICMSMMSSAFLPLLNSAESETSLLPEVVWWVSPSALCRSHHFLGTPTVLTLVLQPCSKSGNVRESQAPSGWWYSKHCSILHLLE